MLRLRNVHNIARRSASLLPGPARRTKCTSGSSCGDELPSAAAIQTLLQGNAKWRESISRSDPGLFDTLKGQQSPDYMWIGCADSRVPANQIVGRLPGEIFVHRNVANQFIHSDFNALSVLQFAVDVLKVKNVVVCGHYGCGGVKAAMEAERHGLVDNWLRPLKALAHRHREELAAHDSFESRFNALCEINVRQQVRHVTQTTVVEDAWSRGQELHVHGAIYSVADGVLTDLHTTISSPEDIARLDAELETH
mmetsp:Transcript_15214/g.47478  ORF Transcript_15214/g.47478 Transcript_15214/m.47478 type:complete len:252 (-) Transcript_15214:37-792(-)